MVYDVIVIGGGHAGCEGALAASRLGCRTLMLTIKYEDVALMPCNPSLGGPGKGQLIRELDALGGEMARNIDQEYMQIRLLNRGKGPAVRALRAQADLAGYQRRMLGVLRGQANLEVVEGKVVHLDEGPPWTVATADGARYKGKCVIVATGTHLRSEIHRGDERFAPEGSSDLTSALERLGLRTIRLKTGTSPRVDGRTIDYTKMQIQPGEDLREGFSFDGELPRKKQAPCYLTYTTPATEALVLENLQRASLYSGAIVGAGPRYCPSIEIKMDRFAGRRQQVFIPAAAVDVEEQGARGVRGIGDVRAPAREIPGQPAVDGAEGQLAALGPGAGAGDVVEQPLELGAGKIGVYDEAGALAEQVGMAGLGQVVADRGGSPILPDDGAVQRLPAGAIPEYRRFALVGDADGGDPRRGDAVVAQHGLCHGKLRMPDFAGVMFHPAGLRKVLGDFLLRDAMNAALTVEEDGAGAGCALIRDVRSGRSSSRTSGSPPRGRG